MTSWRGRGIILQRSLVDVASKKCQRTGSAKAVSAELGCWYWRKCDHRWQKLFYVKIGRNDPRCVRKRTQSHAIRHLSVSPDRHTGHIFVLNTWPLLKKNQIAGIEETRSLLKVLELNMKPHHEGMNTGDWQRSPYIYQQKVMGHPQRCTLNDRGMSWFSVSKMDEVRGYHQWMYHDLNDYFPDSFRYCRIRDALGEEASCGSHKEAWNWIKRSKKFHGDF